MTDAKKPEPKPTRTGFWRSIGGGIMEFIGAFLYRGPR